MSSDWEENVGEDECDDEEIASKGSAGSEGYR
jgi:hypothetical protein